MSWDESFFRVINGFVGRWAWLDSWAFNLPNSRLWWGLAFLLMGYWLWTSWREALLKSVTLMTVIGIADFMGARLKDFFARPRPCLALADIHLLEASCGGLFSFPSNHAINSAVVAAFLQVLYPRMGWASWPLVGLLGLSRVYVGGHYLTDVLGGWIIGGTLGAGAAWGLLLHARVRSSTVV